MTPERWKRAEHLFHEASDLPAADREAYLDRECANDPELRSKVGSMLASDAEGAGNVVKQQVVRGLLDFHAAAPQPARIRRIGPYELVREIGRGGMGTVYLAERADDQYEGKVAIKIVRPGLDTEFFLARFRRERQTLARLIHPNIARLLDSGTSADGLPYIVMEYIDGETITEYCTAQKLGLAARLKLFLSVCAAVAHAHQHFVVHRDIKPGNIMVDREGSPKLLDFGVCKLLYRESSATSSITQTEIILTPDYGSPEQVRGEAVTVASDVYSLGAVLYELFTDEPVHRFEKLTPQHVEHIICETDIAAPSTIVKDRALARKLEGDLDNILMRALQKEPERRYESVEQFANDLRNYVEFRPIFARPDTLRYRAKKFVLRHQRSLALAVALTAAMTMGIVVSVREALMARRHFGVARQLANAFLFDVHDQVKDLPGSLRVRQTILGIALKYLDALAAQAHDDASLRRELAATYERVGELQGHVPGSNPGSTEAAMSSYSKGLALLEALPASREVRIDRVLLHDRMGDLLLGTGQTSDALQHYRRGLDIATTLTADFPNDNLVRRHTANLQLALGRLHRDTQDYAQSLTRMSEGLRLLREASAVDPNLREIQTSEAAALVGIGRAHFGLGNLTEARDSFLRSAGKWDELTRVDPLNAFYRRERMLAYRHLGDVLGNPAYPNLSDWKGARAAFDTMISIAKGLQDADPADAGARLDYGISLMHAAGVPDAGPEARVARLQDARRVLLEASKANPGNIVPKLNIAGIGEQIGGILEKAGDRKGAAAAYTAAYDEAKTLAQTGRISALRTTTACAGRLAELKAAEGQGPEALQLAKEALGIAEHAAAKSDASIQQKALAPRAQAALGRVYRRLRDPAAAHRWLESAASGYRALQPLPGFTPQLGFELESVEKDLLGRNK